MKSLILQRPRASVVYNTFWRFAFERQRIFFRKLAGQELLTVDPVLSRFSFTNAYRASDRVSQYLIRRVLYHGDQSPTEIVLRCVLFRMFNRIATWQLLVDHFGDVNAREFSAIRYGRALDEVFNRGEKIYSSAYIMPSGISTFGFRRKHRNHLALVDRMLKEGVADKLAACCSLQEVYCLLLSYPMLGPFLAFQLAIDLNYSAFVNFAEMDFVVAGPGARSGLRKCFPSRDGWTDEALIQYVTENQEEEFAKRGLGFDSLWGRPLQLIDVQNLFCEIDKYARVAHPDVIGHGNRVRMKRLYRPSTEPIVLWYPPKWRINDRIASGNRAAA